jgi:integrase
MALPVLCVETPRAHRLRQLQEQLIAGAKWSDNDLVFASKTGTGLDARNLIRTFRRVIGEAGLPNARFPDLRHKAATLMLLQGTNPRVVADTLGNADVALTFRVCMHVLPQIQTDAADRMDAMLRQIRVAG